MKFRSQLILITLLAIAGGIRASSLTYTVDLRNTAEHKAHVTLEPTGYTAATLEFQMPVWAPGAYSVTHYGRYVRNIKAIDASGKELPVEQMNDDRWSVKNAKKLKSISYDVADSRDDSTSLYFAMAAFDSAFVFANATCYFGYVNDDKKASSKVIYKIPSSWYLATALPPSKKGYSNDVLNTFKVTEFYAKDYDQLADAPMMAAPELQTRSFREGSAIYDVVVYSDAPFPMDSLAEYTRKVVAAETDFFHDTPFKRYTFLINAPTQTHVTSTAQGALEHANSSDYMLVNLPWGVFKMYGLSILSHEFFHLWNVKRIHSSLLGPFDYTSRVMTTSLWLSEGITDYYAHTLLSRYKITNDVSFYNDMKTWMRAVKNAAPRVKTKSLEDLSVSESQFVLEEAESFYTKGPLVGLMLDLEIRSRTNNKKSLDDVMLALNADAKKGKTFEDADLIHKMERIAGIDLTSFYKRYISGIDSLPIDSYVEKMGLVPVPKDESEGGQMGMDAQGHFIFQHTEPKSSLGLAGVKFGDILVSVDSVPAIMENIEQIVALKDAGKPVHMVLRRDGKEISVVVDPHQGDPEHKKKGWLKLKDNPTEMEKAIRRGVVGADS